MRSGQKLLVQVKTTIYNNVNHKKIGSGVPLKWVSLHSVLKLLLWMVLNSWSPPEQVFRLNEVNLYHRIRLHGRCREKETKFDEYLTPNQSPHHHAHLLPSHLPPMVL